MAVNSSKPAVLFAHGAWHQPAHWQQCRDVFEAAGYDTVCPLQPSTGKLPPIGLKEDAQCIRDELNILVNEQNRDVIVVGHSYGGVVITEGVDEAFSKEKRKADGKEGGVIYLIYLSAFILPLGVSLAGAFGGTLPPFVLVDDRGMGTPADPANLFYPDLPEAARKHWASLIVECPVSAAHEPLTQAGYVYHPTAYLYTSQDPSFPLAIQQSLVKNISVSCNININTLDLPSSHSPFLSMPGRVLESVQQLTST